MQKYKSKGQKSTSEFLLNFDFDNKYAYLYFSITKKRNIIRKYSLQKLDGWTKKG